MITILSNLAPILLGFVSKLIALRSQAATDQQKMLLEAFAAKNDALNSLRDRESKEPVSAALNRRLLILMILGLVIFVQVYPAIMELPTTIEHTVKGIDLFGIFQLTPDQVEYITVEGVVKHPEIWTWGATLIEFYLGSQVAKSTR